ncbi:hypothetical protein AB0C02_28020 [Micromonospora sp. NPDC048999]|uniref:hypothetical protein n=1 Tax=Micromonospora sp. NPDC048999 TaxID=3155391 RepID=UPI00340475F3
MIDLLTSAQVAELAEIRRSSARVWTARRGISRAHHDGQWWYPAGPVIAAVAAGRPPALRLARFVANPLNRTT